MDAGAIKAGQAFVELFADRTRYTKDLNLAAAQLKSLGATAVAFGKAQLAAGLGIITPMLGAAKVFANMGSELLDMSVRTGLSVEALSELKFAANQSSTSIEEVEVAIKKMQKALFDAVTKGDVTKLGGTGKGVAAAMIGSKGDTHDIHDVFRQLGLSITDIKKLKPEDQFQKIGEKLADVENPTKRAAIAMTLFGKSGTSVLPMLKELKTLRLQAKEFGLTITTEDAKKADELGDSFGLLLAVMKKGVFTIGGAIAPLLTELTLKIAGIAKSVNEWISANQGLFQSLLKVGVVLVASGLFDIARGLAIHTLGVFVGGLARSFSYLASLMGVVLSGMGAFFGIIGGILSPLGVVVITLGVLGGAFLKASNLGEAALRFLGERFQELRDTALVAWKGISDALSAGDIVAAAKVLWAAISLEFTKGIGVLKGYWNDLWTYTLQVWNNIQSDIAGIANSTWAGIQGIWVTASNFFLDLWDNTIASFRRMWDDATTSIAKALANVWAFFDKSIDASGIAKILEGDKVANRREIDKGVTDNRAKRDKEAADRQAAIEAERAGRQAVIDQNKKAEANAIDKTQKAKEGKLQDEIDKAKENLIIALEEAEAAAEDAFLKEKLAKELGGKGGKGGVLEGLDKVNIAGTFSAAGVAGLGGSGMDRVAKSTEETAKNTEKIAKRLADAARDPDRKLVFGRAA